MSGNEITPGPAQVSRKTGWAKLDLRLQLAYVLTAAFIITSVVMVARVVFVVGTLALNWHMQPIPGMVVDHAVLADSRAQFHIAATTDPAGVFVVQGANANDAEHWIDGKLGKDRMQVGEDTYPILWEATDWTVFPNRTGAGGLDTCNMSEEHGRRVVRTTELSADVIRAIENGEAFIVVAYNPNDIDPRKLATPLT